MDLALLPPADINRMVRAVERVKERMLRTARTLEGEGIPYAIISGNAVAAWVSRVDEAAGFNFSACAVHRTWRTRAKGLRQPRRLMGDHRI